MLTSSLYQLTMHIFLLDDDDDKSRCRGELDNASSP